MRAIPVAVALLLVCVVPGGAWAQTVTRTCPILGDTLLRQLTPDSSYDTYPKGWADSAVAGIAGSWIETLLRFDVSKCLPSGARVSAANIELYVTNASAATFELYQMLRPFSSAATWNVYRSGTSWAKPGAMGAGTDFGARVASTKPSVTGRLTIPVTASTAQAWVGSTTTSLVVRPTGTPGTNNAPSGFAFRSKEHTSGNPPVLNVTYSVETEVRNSTFKVVTWNMQYGKGMTTKASGMTCALAGLKENAQCQIADNPNTAINERTEERKHSAWGIGLTQRHLDSADVLGDPEVAALLLTEVNNGACFSQADLMAVVRRVWPDAAISKAFRDNWIVARWGFVPGAANYGQRDIAPCGFKDVDNTGKLVPWPTGYAEGIQWGRIYTEDPDPDGDGIALPDAHIVNVFNAHWPLTGFNASGDPFFCLANATGTRDFANAPVAGVNLTGQPRIIGADFNSEDVVRPSEDARMCEPYGGRAGFDVLRQAGFVDAFTAAGAAATTPTSDGSTGMIGRASTESCYRDFSDNGLFMPYKRIDYQLVQGGTTAGTRLAVTGFELFGVDQFGNCVPSDHMGTKVQYKWF